MDWAHRSAHDQTTDQAFYFAALGALKALL